jgi:hypothetical protein
LLNLGSKRKIISKGKGIIQMPAIKLKVMDSTGADAFGRIFLFLYQEKLLMNV